MDNLTKKKSLVALLLPVVAAGLIGLFQYGLPIIISSTSPWSSPTPTPTPTPTQQTFAGKVSDEQTGNPIPAAKVSLEAKGLSPVTYTDSEGRFSFPLPPELREIRILVVAKGHVQFERKIDVFAKTEPEDIRLASLEPSPTPTPQAAATPRRTAKSRGLSLEQRKRQALDDLKNSSKTNR